MSGQILNQSIRQWLEKFLTNRTYISQHNIPLYEYQVTRDEYQSLRSCLTASQKFSIKNKFSDEWCGAFTLYCAEWFRREYSREWSWNPIFITLNFELSASEISDVVSRGLCRFWNRPLSKHIVSERNDFLGSVFREGGLPSNLLSSDTNNYQSAFYSIFERYQDIKEFGTDAIEKLIKNRIARLPETLQSDDSVELISRMVEQLDSLVYRFGLDKEDKPAQYLDTHFPRWREIFPLPLEDTTGSAFLRQLLTRATDEVRKSVKKRQKLGCRHYLSFANQAIYTDITLPTSCFFDISRQQLSSSRIELAIFEGNKQIASLGTGFALFEQEKTIIRMRLPKVRVKRENSESELYLVAMQAGCRLANIRLKASSVDVGDSPLTVIKENDLWRLLSQASLQTKHTKVMILLPISAEVKVEYGQTEDLNQNFQNMRVIELEGRCQIICSKHERYIITTSSDGYLSDSLTLRGEQLRWKSIPALVFKGIPKVLGELDDDENSQKLISYLGASSVKDLSRSEVNGRQLFTARDSDGIIRLRKHIGILPNDFYIELLSGETPHEGVIKIKTLSPCVCQVTSDLIHVDRLSKESGATVIQISAVGDIPPATIPVQIQASILSEPIIIEVPFPARGAIAYDGQGNQLATKLTVEELLGSRLYFFSTPGVPASYQLEAMASSRNIKANHKPPYIRWHYKVTDKPVEVSLYGLKEAILELLSLTDELDSEVELRITGPGRTLYFTVSRYSASLDYDRDNNTVFLRSGKLSSSEKVKPVLISLAAPEQKPFVLQSRESEGVPVGEYELPIFMEQGGPWLIVPDRSSEIFFRARFFPGQNDDLNLNDVDTLQKAAMVYHPQNNPVAIANVLHQMSNDWGHSGWQYLRDTYKNFAYLPLSTFEVWRHLVRDHHALAVALFIFENDERLIAHIENELPVFWEFISVDDWLHAVDLMENALIDKGLPDSVIKQVIEKQIDKLGEVIPSLKESVVSYLKTKAIPKTFPSEILQPMVFGWYQDLLRQHSEDNHWPVEYGEQLCQWCTELSLVPFQFKVSANFQTSVVYLPLFSAAMACGKIPENVINALPTESVFYLRKLRDFDHEWFEPAYRCFVTYFLNQLQ
ncbi:STY4851/ECs_5259 family protein [Vibrio albus]|uniref:STY4851/ECs_5259 family protein n=1 Tax=Vibrio albus TaxID=2200953 RepID=UPI001C63A45D|nr:STY4851/ECs_5259 family protein [Vibrio albus]